MLVWQHFTNILIIILQRIYNINGICLFNYITYKKYNKPLSKRCLYLSKKYHKGEIKVSLPSTVKIGGKTNSIYSDVESFVQTKLDRYPDLLELILKKEKIDAALEGLNYKEKRLVRFKYFEGMTDNEVSDKMRELELQTFKWRSESTCKDYSSTTIQRMKTRVLKKLHKVGM